MKLTKSYIKIFTDMMSEGFIVIDTKGIIQVYNQKAKEIFGINLETEKDHEKGKIHKGDIVIIGDNILGQDDGMLEPDSLQIIGVEGGFQKGDAIVAIGIYGGKGIFKFLKKGHKERFLELNHTIEDRCIQVKIDFLDKNISINIDNQNYNMNYINAVGNIVILDGETKNVKFYQSHGYTARGESINDLLKGKRYRGKGEDVGDIDVLGKTIFEIHRSDSIIQQFAESAKGENIIYIDKFEEINGYPTMCTLLPLEIDGARIGAALKVEDISEIKKIIRERDNLISQLEEAETQLTEEETLNQAFPTIIGDSEKIQYVKKLALKASNTNSNVLILGESGTGKTILAKAIHENSKFKERAFVHVNCAAIPESLLESELFGYEKGAFTGAKAEGKKGLFEIANGGTIFLDEIGEIPLSLQVKLLQAIQEKSFYRVGGTEKIKVNIRIIAATNRNLEKEMEKGNFREDLYYRINVFPIWIPPLRERIEDINPLIQLILPKICEEIGCEPKGISSEAINVLLRYNWAGNIRELENILERAINLTEGKNILSSHIDIRSKKETNILRESSLKEYLEEYEKAIIEKTISIYNGNKKNAMQSLKMSKTTFYDKLKKYNID